MSFEDVTSLRAAFFAGLTPDPTQTIDQWADEHMQLPSWSAEPGRWRTSRTPYLGEIMQCLSPSSPYRRIVFMKCAQIGGTECGKNWIGYTVHRSPGSMLIVEPTVDVAKKLSKQKVQPMFDAVSCLKGKVKDARSRDSGNTILAKEFTGGMMVLTGANSGVGLRFMSAQNLFLDEVDAYPYDVDGEGPPVAVAEKRTLTYARHKIYLCSTPLLKETSVIEPEYEASDQRHYQVPCPFCHKYQILYWKQLRWPEGRPEQAKYACAHCDKLIGEHHKTAMLANGHWKATHPHHATAGFHLNALYAPYGWVNSWAHLAEEWTRIIHKRDLRQQQTFTNTNLAETWEEKAEKIDTASLANRKEDYAAPCPEGVLVLTAAVDVQDDRIETLCQGWGLDEEQWSIDYQRFYGSPAQPEVWKLLDAWLQKSWLHACGVPMKIIQTVVDTGGHHTKEAYAFCKARHARRVFAIKGSNQPAFPLVGRPSGNNLGNVQLFTVGTDTAKDTLFPRFKLETFGPGYCHFPKTENYDDEFFAQLTSEERRTKYDKGVAQGYYYKKIRARNEALDCFDHETELLTASGWKSFAAIMPSDRLATVNLQTDYLEFQRPLAIIQKPYDGEMIHIHGRRINILVTPNHRMVTYRKLQRTLSKGIRKWDFNVQPRITLAKNLDIWHSLKLTSSWIGNPSTTIRIPASFKTGIHAGEQIEPERKLNAHDWASFLGWYISEGSAGAPISRTQGSARYRVVITQNDGPKADLIANLLMKLPWRWRRYRNTFIITSKQLWTAIQDCGKGAMNKRVPQWIKDAMPSVIGAFIDAAIAGDGWIQTKPGQRLHRIYSTVSRQLADDIQELFIKNGCAANIKTVAPRPCTLSGQGPTLPQYHVSECKVKKAYLQGPKMTCLAKRIHYDGTVYCATVPNGTLILRRDGKSFIAGNCMVYNLAALAILNPNLQALAEAMQHKHDDKPAPKVKVPGELDPLPPKLRRHFPGRQGWVGGWK